MNPVTRGSAKETALSIPEILSIVFSKLPSEAQAACACVCKKWSEVTLNELWRNLEDIHPLLRLIIDIDSFYTEGEMHEGILRVIRDADWPTFRKYAIRAGSIKFDPDRTEMPPPSAEGIAFLCLHHRFGTCFTPNVRKIQWAMASEHCATLMVPFISENLEELKIEIRVVTSWSAWSTTEIFPCLVHRTPTLKKLYIEAEELPRGISESFCSWIRTCVGLEEARIPRQWQTSTIVAAFGSLPKLIEFGHQWINPPDYGEGGGISGAISGGCFRSLRRLGWSGNIKRAQDLLRQTSRQLQGLTFDCTGETSQGEVMAFLTTALDCCPELDSLCLNLAEVSDAVDSDGEQAPLNPSIFRPLLACNTLRKLRIHYSYPCIISISDVGKMGDAWPKMTELVLCPDPNVNATGETQGTAISTLPHIAAAFPRLRVLGLHFDSLETPGSAGDLLPESQFRCLEELDVGTAPVPDPGPVPVGLYLASLCNVGTRLSIWAYMSDVRSRYAFGCESSSFHDWEMVETLTHETMRIKEAVVRRFCSR